MSAQTASTVENDSVEGSPWAALWRRFGPDGARRRAADRDRAIDDAHHAGEIKWLWRSACEGSGLARLVFTASGQAMSIPTIGRIRIGRPTSFTVRLQPGQLPRDIAAVAPRLADAMGVHEVRVTPLAAEWVRIELLTSPPPAGAAGATVTLAFPASVPAPGPYAEAA